MGTNLGLHDCDDAAEELCLAGGQVRGCHDVWVVVEIVSLG